MTMTISSALASAATAPRSARATADSELWRDVCLASAHFQRARTLHESSDVDDDRADPAGGGGIDEATAAAAEMALELYQSCHRRAKKRSYPRSLSGSDASDPRSGRSPTAARERVFTVNLELRMAQALRFLALLHVVSRPRASSSNNDDSENAIIEDAGLEAAIKYHDNAVSLLVGVFDEEEEEGEAGEDDNIDAIDEAESGGNSERRDPRKRGAAGRVGVRATDAWSVESLSDASQDGTGSDARIMLTIQVPQEQDDGMLTRYIQDSGGAEAVVSPSSVALRATFLHPTEDERVRAIAVSLNALAELHARRGDDRAAMGSYKEALEILRAANEEEEEDDIDDSEEGEASWAGGAYEAGRLKGKPQSPPTLTVARTTTSAVQIDLANTLMNVGNFHLRRDELDAALNAYSTVWALHNGAPADRDIAESLARPPSTSTPEGGSGDAGVASVPPSYLNPPQSSAARKLSTPDGGDGDVRPPPPSASPGALSALSNLGIVHERRGELREALSCFERVHSARTASLGREHTDSLGSLINIGNCRQRLGDWDGARSAYEEAVLAYGRALRMRAAASGIAGDMTMTRILRILRPLAGALRNWGTCYWKQRRVSEAIDCLNQAVDAEGKIAALLSDRGGFARDAARQAKESTAQIMGLIGCLHLEYKLEELRSFDKSEEAFRGAIQLYEELGYDELHPSALWARHNLTAVEAMRDQMRDRLNTRLGPPTPSPPQLTTPPSVKPAAPPVKTDNEGSNAVDMDDIDSAELSAALATDDEDIGGGVNDNGDHDVFPALQASSTDELDDILKEMDALPPKERASGIAGEGRVSAQAEVDLCKGEQPTNGQLSDKEEGIGVVANEPLSKEQCNMSSSLLDDQEEEESPGRSYDVNDEEDERLSQLQLQAERPVDGETLEAASAHIALAEHCWKKSDHSAATKHYTEAHSIYQSCLGDNSAEVAMVLKKLGDLNAEENALDAARELYIEALEVEQAVHGRFLPGTLNAAGAACLKNDDFRSAMEFHRRALQIQRKSTGGNKYEMYETLVRIGNVYYSERNNFTTIRSGSRGADYGDFIESGFLGWIANAHDMRGEYIRATQFYEESLQIYMSRKGKEAKRETALTFNRLGSLTRELGRYDEAMDYHQKALNIQRSGSGVAKAMTAETCVLMGMCKSKMGEFRSALDLYEDSILVLKNALGEDHSSSWKTMAQIGSVHFELSNYSRAMEILLEAERWQLSSVGEENRDTLETQALIGRVLSATGKYKEAVRKLKDVSERQRKLFGSNHPAIADTLSYIGTCFLDQGMATDARVQYVNCYNMRKQFFTVDQIHIAESMVDIIRARSGQPERALAIYRNAMEVFGEYLSDDHIQIGRLHVYQGDSNAELLHFSTAIEHYEKAKRIFHKVFEGECAIDLALVAVNIGKVLLRKCDYDLAKSSFSSALESYQHILPEGHPNITSTLNHLNRVEQEEALCV